EFRKIAVDQSGAQHQHDLTDHERMPRACLVRIERYIIEPRRRTPLGICHQLHQQHAVEDAEGPGHAHAGALEPIERVDLGALPVLLLQVPAVPAATAHGARIAAAAHLATFLVFGETVKAAMVRVLVHLGAADFAPALDQEHRGFLAALQSTDHGIDYAVFD